MKQQNELEMREGAIAFLDILGFKGLWEKISPSEIISIMKGSVAKVEDTFNVAVSEQVNKIKDSLPPFTDIREEVKEEVIKSQLPKLFIAILSDTFVIVVESIEPHPLVFITPVVTELIAHFFKQGIPLRGAVSFGNFYHDDEKRIFIGPAIDNAGSSCNSLDMIGIMASSKMNPLLDKFNQDDHQMGFPPYVKYNAPMKGGNREELYCINWPSFFCKGNNNTFGSSSYLDKLNLWPEERDERIDGKRKNTKEFIEHCLKNHPARS